MKTEIVAVYDLAGELWSKPFFVPTLGLAIRTFTDEINRPDENNSYWKHPADYNLHHIGTWDDSTGDLIGAADRRLLVRGVEVKQLEKVNGKSSAN